MEGTGTAIKDQSFEHFCESVERMFKNKPTRANMSATVYAFRKAIFEEIYDKAFREGEDAGKEEERPEPEPVGITKAVSDPTTLTKNTTTINPK